MTPTPVYTDTLTVAYSVAIAEAVMTNEFVAGGLLVVVACLGALLLIRTFRSM